jgi:Ran GTPase-activating protein (RanGAP) involved in mRNA processing and transport
LAAAQTHTAAGTSLLVRLQVLDLGCNALGDAGAATLAQYCEQLSSVQLLGLSGNGIGADGARALFGCMSSSRSSSSVSASSSNGRKPGSQIGATMSSTNIAAQPRWLPALRVLQLGGNFLGDAGASALAAALPELRQLRQLQLQDNYSIGKGPYRTRCIETNLIRFETSQHDVVCTRFSTTEYTWSCYWTVVAFMTTGGDSRLQLHPAGL